MNKELEEAKAKIREGCVAYLRALLKVTGSAEVSVLMLAKSIEQICTSFTDEDIKGLEEEGASNGKSE